MLKRIIIMILGSLIVFGLVACGSSQSGTGNSQDGSSSTVTPSISPSPKTSLQPPHVTGVVMSVNPSSFSSVGCGASTNITFSAAIVVANGSSGGQIPYTWNINNSFIPGNVSFAPGQTTKTVTYAIPNYVAQLSSTSAVSGSITVGRPGAAITSSSIGPSGNCNLPGPFQVTGISISVSPASVAGLPCGTSVNVVYTATIYIAPDSNAGTVYLTWSIDTYYPKTSVFFAPAQTVQTVTYSQTGTLVKDNANGFPRHVSIASTSPTAASSVTIKPIGLCR